MAVPFNKTAALILANLSTGQNQMENLTAITAVADLGLRFSQYGLDQMMMVNRQRSSAGKVACRVKAKFWAEAAQECMAYIEELERA